MPDRPLLFFPRRTWAERSERSGAGRNFHLPDPTRQRDRLQPMFSEMERAFEAKRLELRDSPAGLMPEQALVLETIDTVEEFYKDLETLQGLEWMGERDLEGIDPDEDFYDLDNPGAKLPGRVYLIVQNEQGRQELLSLWKIFNQNPEHPQFQKRRTKFGYLFRKLKTLRPWNYEDRLRETGLLEEWQERVEEGREVMGVEVELWPHRNPGRRKRIERIIEDLTRHAGGEVLARRDAVLEYAYHGMLLRLPISAVERILKNSGVGLIRCEQIMFLRPVGQISSWPIVNGDQEQASDVDLPLPQGEPIAALLDGLPVENHMLLADRLIVDDPDDWKTEYPVDHREHGTAMASLIIHDELDSANLPLGRPLYVRPVLKPRFADSSEAAPNYEIIPEDALPVDLIHRALLRVLEGEGEDPPVAPKVRIINLSIGDPWRPFDNFPSPWARLLDYFAAKYNILFVVSAGNCPQPVELDVPRNEREQLLSDPDRLRRETLRSILQDTRHRRLLAPAEAINVLTVGALNSDHSREAGRHIDPLGGADLPSPYSAHGLGFNRSVKPEVLFRGGRLLYRERYGSSEKATLEQVPAGRPPGQKVAAPGRRAGDLAGVSYVCGTSNAAALVTRVSCQLYELLLDLRRSQEQSGGPPDENLAVLIRTLLVHGASWGGREEILQRDLELTGRSPMTRFLGYGALQSERVLACTDQRVTLLGWGVVDPGRAYTYRLPLPMSLNGSNSFRRMTTTLSWFSPINARTREYRQASLWLSYSGIETLGISRKEVDERQSRRGTIQHEIWEGDRATLYSENEELLLKVNRRDEDGYSVPYGLAVTLEVAESTDLPIYEEVRTGLQIQAPIRPRIAT